MVWGIAMVTVRARGAEPRMVPDIIEKYKKQASGRHDIILRYRPNIDALAKTAP